MPRGFFPQCIAVLFEALPSLEELVVALTAHGYTLRFELPEEWEIGGPKLLVPYRPEVNGVAAIDVVHFPWPDSMENTQENGTIFKAWNLGAFGPFAFPQGLERAIEFAWRWKDAAKQVRRHKSFVRIRSCYAYGRPDAALWPSDYAALPELHFLSTLAECILTTKGSICYFDPAGECLHPREAVTALLRRHNTSGPIAQELWANIRVHSLSDDPGWVLMDLIGAEQLDVPDQEACFFRQRYDSSEVASFLRTVVAYLVANGPIVNDGNTIDGPGGIAWKNISTLEAFVVPPRETITWFPLDELDARKVISRAVKKI